MLPVSLCQTKAYSCFGCCGHHYKGKDRVSAAIDKNSERFNSGKSLTVLSKQAEQLDSSGVCKAVIHKQGRRMCGLHPKQHNGSDFRDALCDKNFLCGAMKAWVTWDEQTKKRFLRFVHSLQLDWYDYSLQMDNGSIYNQFLTKYK